MYILTTIAIRDGKLERFPNSRAERAERAGPPYLAPWAASVKSPESSDYVDEFLNERGTTIIPVHRLKLYSAVVFACDEYEYGHVALYNRWYGVVIGISDDAIEFEQCESQEDAHNLAKSIREDVPF